MHTTLPGNPLLVLYDSNHIALVLCQVNIYGMRALNFESNRSLLLSTPELMTSCISVAGWDTQAARPGGLQEFLWPCSLPLFCRKNRWPMIQRILSIITFIHGSRGMTLKILKVSISLFFSLYTVKITLPFPIHIVHRSPSLPKLSQTHSLHFHPTDIPTPAEKKNTLCAQQHTNPWQLLFLLSVTA